ncbi:MAG: UvrD-helicase domain-containing protein [Peptostreptococcaceae bacterium]
MKKLITESFIKNLPIERKEFILEKVDNFINVLENNNNEIKNIPNSYSVRKVKGNENIFKFRVDIANRVLFTFASKVHNIRENFKEDNAIVILDYCNHDNQIKRARGLNVNVNYVELEKEELFEELIDENYKAYYYNPDEVITRIVDNKTLVDLIKEDDKNAIYYLNEEQEECLRSNLTPLFLFGSAGSGKTTVGVNKIYSLYKAYNINIGYFTYSKLLMKETSNMFEYLCSQNGKSDFNSKVSFKYLSKFLYSKSNKTKPIDYYKFEDWFYTNANRNAKVKKLNIDVLDIYKEIRGIIKGLVGLEWMPYINFNLEQYNYETVEFLKDKQFLNINNNEFSLNTNIDKIEKVLILTNVENKNIIEKDLKKIKIEVEKSIFTQSLIDKNSYFNLPSEYSIYNREEREIIYDLSLKYEDYLKDNNLYDENDITRMVLAELNKGNIEKYDFILVDEIQDLTEIQIYLMYKLVKDPMNILFSGDFNQTINPTFFNTTRIESLFMSNSYNNKFYKKMLSTNYRSSKDIVELSNEVANLRIEKLYKNKRNDYLEKPIRNHTNKPFLLKNDEDNKKKLLNMVNDRHYVAIVVCDDAEKEKLKYEMGIETSVYTLAEIKGIEKNYIICYNIISSHKDKWNEIFSGVSYENHSLYRYYFNMLYVAITRARDYVCFYEDEIDCPLYDSIEDLIEKVEHFDEGHLMFDYISKDDDYIKEGKYLESKEKYDQAILQYKKSKSSSVKNHIKRCEALMLKDKGKYCEAGSKLLKLKEYELASECYLEDENYIKVIKSFVLMRKNYEEIIREFEEYEINPLEIVLEKGIKEAWIKDFYSIYNTYIDKKIDKNRENIDLITTIISMVNED